MIRLMKSEYRKGCHSLGRRCLVLFPLLVCLMAITLMGGQLTQAGAYNWWYMMFLPICTALICINLIETEKQMKFFNVLILPIPKGDVWLAKVLVGWVCLFFGNLIVFGFTTISGIFFGAQHSILRGIAAILVLTVTWAWQIPMGMFLSAKFNSTVTFLAILGMNVICSIQTIAGGSLWILPFAIPARLMAPILGINPNGTPMTPDSPLHDSTVVLPGIIISVFLAIILLLLTKNWFQKRGE